MHSYDFRKVKWTSYMRSVSIEYSEDFMNLIFYEVVWDMLCKDPV